MFQRKWFAVLLGGSILAWAGNGYSQDGEKPPVPAKRYIIKVNRIDPKESGGVVLKNSVAELKIAGVVTDLMHPGDTLILKVKGATISELTFEDACELQVAKDKALLATQEGVVAKDPSGKPWKSRKVKVGKEEVFAFFPE